ncbi:kinesin-like protein KIN-10C isoform X2 [Panicum virgatum]|uniref:kinesin-like protein KIN-10C isoform X2 n=1 Tax=Panicum virgatum TaxID=38727 RepID=UPI0019D5CDDB|nr:kinesin-like protein KIN-10C isoform X2 [Panicum virgatum]
MPLRTAASRVQNSNRPPGPRPITVRRPPQPPPLVSSASASSHHAHATPRLRTPNSGSSRLAARATPAVFLSPMAAAATPARSAATSSQPVRVVLRVRPFLQSEGTPAEAPCVCLLGSHPGGEVTVQLKDQHTSRSEHYKLDAFFGQEDSISQLFDREVSTVIPGIFNGVNATVFAYGATGSGKTYTMQGTEDFPGLIPLAASTVLSLCTGTWCSVEISYYEVYMERCYDLLEPKAKEIMALDDKDGNMRLKGLSWVPVRSMEEFQELYSIGVQRRKVAHTGMNDVSSRSHAVLSIRVSADVVKGRINLIDLAGSEDNRRTFNEGIRLQESAKINQSLFALSNVISALNKNELRIPYRESKLTRILQDSLGGSSRAVMIACLNPAEYQESVNTVSLAARSRHMGNFTSSASKQETPKVKVDMEAKLRAWLESKGKTKSIQRMDGLFSPIAGKTPFSVSHMKQPASSRVSCRSKAMDQDGGKIKKILFDPEVHVPTEKIPREHMQNEENTPKKVLPSASQCKEKHEASLRKALSPISSNVVPANQQISDNVICAISLEPQTPIETSKIEKIPSATPLDKFNVLGSNIKEAFIQQYLDFLNVANKEELQQLKGIGMRRAEYILELREESPTPFKTLADLENIGLSSKQIQDILRKTASGIFK